MSEDCHCSNNSKIKKDNAMIMKVGPFGPHPEPPTLLELLADDMEWMLKDILWRGRQTDLPAEQSDEMKKALNNYRDLCIKIGKDATLL